MNLSSSQLSLFEDLDTPRAAPPRPAPPGVAPGIPVSTTCPPELPPGARWREVQTPDQAIGFVLLRSRRKSIGLVVNDDGLQVTAPGWVSLGQVDATVVEKSRWILDKLRVRQQRQEQLAMADTQWCDGGRIPYLGVPIILRLGHAGHGHQFEGSLYFPQENNVLHLALPADTERHRVRDSVQAWLQSVAHDWLEQRLQHFVQANGLTMKRWRLSGAATRWGSCNSDGSIMLNWRLIHFGHDIIDYVVAHEVAHLRQMNHSKDFWREVGRILPGFEAARDALRRHNPASLPLL